MKSTHDSNVSINVRRYRKGYKLQVVRENVSGSEMLEALPTLEELIELRDEINALMPADRILREKGL